MEFVFFGGCKFDRLIHKLFGMDAGRHNHCFSRKIAVCFFFLAIGQFIHCHPFAVFFRGNNKRAVLLFDDLFNLFSPKLSVSGNTAYSVGVFADTVAVASGELGFYIDEYDANGNWVSGKWLGQAENGVAREYLFLYARSSANVASISLQIYYTFSPQGSAYIDNARIFTP